MLCGKCKRPLICEYCLETEFSPNAEEYGKHKFVPTKCECEKEIKYINLDAMWYIRSFFDVVMILIFLICLIGFIASWFVLIWNKEIANIMMGCSFCVGLVNILFLVSSNDGWRVFYEDDHMVFDIKEEGEGGHEK